MIKDHQESSLKFKKQKHTLKVFLGVSLIIFLLVFIGVINVLLKNKYEDNSINKLSLKAEEIRQQNEGIGNLIKNYNTDTVREKMVREDLNLMIEGENVVVINDDKKEIQISKKIYNTVERTKYISNYAKWINFFFEKE